MATLNEMAERLRLAGGSSICSGDEMMNILGMHRCGCPVDGDGVILACSECRELMRGKLADALDEAAGELAKSVLPSMPADADGVPCLLDDAVWHKGRKHAVVAVSHKGKVCIRDWERREEGDGAKWVKADAVSHVKADTMEAIKADAAKEILCYWKCVGASCGECPAAIDGENPMKRYGVDNCKAAQMLDLLERQRRILGGEHHG